MDITKTTKSKVLFGNSFNNDVPTCPKNDVMITLKGKSGSGAPAILSFDKNLLSKHIVLMGGIGTGKTNTFSISFRS